MEVAQLRASLQGRDQAASMLEWILRTFLEVMDRGRNEEGQGEEMIVLTLLQAMRKLKEQCRRTCPQSGWKPNHLLTFADGWYRIGLIGRKFGTRVNCERVSECFPPWRLPTNPVRRCRLKSKTRGHAPSRYSAHGETTTHLPSFGSRFPSQKTTGNTLLRTRTQYVPSRRSTSTRSLASPSRLEHSCSRSSETSDIHTVRALNLACGSCLEKRKESNTASAGPLG